MGSEAKFSTIIYEYRSPFPSIEWKILSFPVLITTLSNMTYSSRHISFRAFCKAAHHSRCVDGDLSVAALRFTVSHQGRMQKRDDSVTLEVCEQQVTSTKCPSFCFTTSSLAKLRVLVPQSCDCSYYVSRRILATQPLWLHKHTNLCTQDFAHPHDVQQQLRHANITSAWSWRLCRINFDMYMSYRPVISYDLAHRTYTLPSSWRHTIKNQKLSSVAHAHRVTSMADINTDAVRKQKKAEYNKEYRLKCKMLLQQPTSKDIYMFGYFHP
jgi:hypothetical protein